MALPDRTTFKARYPTVGATDEQIDSAIDTAKEWVAELVDLRQDSEGNDLFSSLQESAVYMVAERYARRMATGGFWQAEDSIPSIVYELLTPRRKS